MPRLITFSGALRSGKDTAADYLVAKHGFVKFQFSEPLHDAMMALDPIVATGSFSSSNPGHTEAQPDGASNLTSVFGVD